MLNYKTHAFKTKQNKNGQRKMQRNQKYGKCIWKINEIKYILWILIPNKAVETLLHKVLPYYCLWRNLKQLVLEKE